MKRNKFSLSHTKLFSCNMGGLIPCGLTEVLPGDTLQHNTSALVRVSPMLAPVMHPVHVKIHHWFVPHRIVWDDFESFITGGSDGNDASVFPTITETTAESTLGDYYGLPVGVTDNEFSALPYRGYAKIWNEWYRDQDLQTELVIDTTSGPDTTTDATLQNVGWEKDYFTSARPWEQKGSAVTIPISGTAPVTGIGKSTQDYTAVSDDAYETGASAVTSYASSQVINPGLTSYEYLVEEDPANTGYPNIYADLSNATGIEITALREALSLQRFKEARARWGSRYVEYLAYLGVRSSDARQQRPEYLGGGKQTLQFSEVLQTAEGTNPVGDLKGHGIAAMRSNKYRRYYEEHGYVHSFMSVKPKTIYTDGMARTWNRRIKEDFWQKELEHIGQQTILNKELYAGAASPDGTFGFQDRYDEYRRHESQVSGQFRQTELDHWHFARMFGTEPALNADFIKCSPATRPFAVPSEDTLWVMAMHKIGARRMLSKTGTSHVF